MSELYYKEEYNPHTNAMKDEITRLKKENEELVFMRKADKVVMDTREDRIKALTDGLRERVKSGHNDTCSSCLGDYPCTCGHDVISNLIESDAKCIGHKVGEMCYCFDEERDPTEGGE